MGATRNDLILSTPLAGANADYVEAMYERFIADPADVTEAWRNYFNGLAVGGASERSHRSIQSGIAERARLPRSVASPASASKDATAKQGAVSRLIQIYANRGHLVANLDPLGLTKRPRPRVLDL